MANEDIQSIASKHVPTLSQSPIYQGYQVEEDRITILVSKRPKAGQLPQSLDGVPVQYEVVGELGALTWNKMQRPAIGGISVGHKKISAGTLGAILWIDGEPYIISNSHVIAASGEAQQGDPIYQPGSYDIQGELSSEHIIGHLEDWKEFDYQGTNSIDIAIAKAIPEKVEDIIKGTKPAPTSYVESIYAVELGKGDTLFKPGRTTEITRGRIKFSSASDVQVAGYPRGKLVFNNVGIVESLESTPFVRGGDSGAAIIEPSSGRLAGFVFAGSMAVGVYCKIGPILEWLQRETKFRLASYETNTEWIPAYAGIGLMGTGVAVGARE